MGKRSRKNITKNPRNGYPVEQSTWEPEENIECHDLLVDCERKRSRMENNEIPVSSSKIHGEKQLPSHFGSQRCAW
ncbi:hypothetical protein KIN20_003935 [Parelaphostrongylus tenuis]|uniref:Chromo domain-containing protein n=1 Tax=Parelaphostrongylus tenuis TaxID=148309 RepID=A0AAD5QER0_PARTN|nr:hypothetical protein KIN20_003935 [Parelaphostrongylus tenuis]